MSTAELIYEKAKNLPNGLQEEALGYVEYLSRRPAARAEVAEWQTLLRETQSSPATQQLTDADIASEIAAYRTRK